MMIPHRRFTLVAETAGEHQMNGQVDAMFMLSLKAPLFTAPFPKKHAPTWLLFPHESPAICTLESCL